jgi:hypothetical protein
MHTVNSQAVESNVQSAQISAQKRLENANARAARQAREDSCWMNDMQEEAELEMLRYETQHSGRAYAHLF